MLIPTVITWCTEVVEYTQHTNRHTAAQQNVDMSKFRPPESFTFHKPTEWPAWRARFARYRLATKLNKEAGEVQVSALIYGMGPEAEHVFQQFHFEKGEKDDDYDTVLAKFEKHFVPKRNVMHERGRFFQIVQKSGETVEEFVRHLYETAEHCDFGDNKSEYLRDRLVLGMADRELSERLQLRSEGLTLEDAVHSARQSELVKTQMSAQASPSTHQNVQEVKATGASANRGAAQGGARKKTGKKGQKQFQKQQPQKQQQDGSNCDKCGRTHPDRPCPARRAQCYKCHKHGHFAQVCGAAQQRPVQPRVYEVTTQEAPTFFLDSISCHDAAEPAWREDILTQGGPIDFKLDSGADVTVISETTLNKLNPTPELETVQTKLMSPGGPLTCKGQFMASAEVKQQRFRFRVLVTEGNSTDSLLSRSVAVKMGLMQRLEEISLDDSELFGDIGLLDCEPVRIKLKPGAVPYSIPVARRVPIPLLPALEAELQRMESHNIIERVTDAIDWCSPMVAVPKKNNKLRICVDLKHLNQSVVRSKHILPVLDDVLHKLSGATVFSKVDASSGFWQIPLDKDSSALTTFITPFGRYKFLRLPFGITSAPELFQQEMEKLLADLPGVIVIMDDILVFGATREEHDERLQAVLSVIKSKGMKLNKAKCLFGQDELPFMGHIVGRDGVKPDPEKVAAICKLPAPQNQTELRRIIGMATYLGRFLDDLSTLVKPMTDLLKSDVVWQWGPEQVKAFQNLKDTMSSERVLVFYDPSRPTVVSADASSFGLGAVLLQQHGTKLMPVTFASRTLTSAETRYAQIEKELLASTWACEKFSRYLVGLESFKIQTDHKPLVTVINSQDLDKAPVRCQRLLMRLMKYNVTAVYVPGKDLVVADTLSRSPMPYHDTPDSEPEIAGYVDAVMEAQPVSPQRLVKIEAETNQDAKLQKAMKYVRFGWPDYTLAVAPDVRDLFPVRAELSIVGNLLVRDSRIVMPEALRAETLQSLHEGHLGVHKCKERAMTAVWWPGLAKDIEDTVANCSFCQTNRPTQRKEPLMPTQLPTRPWQRVGADLFDLDGRQHLVVVDYYSRYIEIAQLSNMTSAQVIGKLKNFFARWGIPDELVSDNGTQFSSEQFRMFAQTYGFTHITSSPHFPQANGEAERAVQTAKRILRQEDSFLALMAYRSTPVTPTGASPCQLIMGRQINTRVPTLERNLQPQWPDLDKVRAADQKAKAANSFYYNRQHGARPLIKLRPGDSVRVKLDGEKTWGQSGTVKSQYDTPRSYIVETPGGTYRRNRKHLQVVPSTGAKEPPPVEPTRVEPIPPLPRTPQAVPSSPVPAPRSPAKNSDVATTRCGRAIVKPLRYRE